MREVYQLVRVYGREEGLRRAIEGGCDPKLLEVAQRLYGDDEISLGVLFAGWCILNLPHRQLGRPEMSWRREIRRNDFVCQLVVEPGELQVGKQTRLFGVPFGSTARIILLFLQSEALRNNSREVELGPSLGAWLQRLDIPHGGKSYRLVREQLLRISACSLRFMWGGHDESGQPLSGFKKDAIIQEGVLMLGPDDAERQHMLWQDRIVVGESFFRALKERPVPINLKAVRAIMHSSRATDIYVWLTYRCFRLERPVKISWPALKEQFGDPQHRLDRFRDRFTDALKLAQTAYPECQITVDTRKGLTIFPSPPAVPERRYLQLVPSGLPAPKPAPLLDGLE
jgi:Plasmid encoded RepA protein